MFTPKKRKNGKFCTKYCVISKHFQICMECGAVGSLYKDEPPYNEKIEHIQIDCAGSRKSLGFFDHVRFKKNLQCEGDISKCFCTPEYLKNLDESYK